MDFFDLVNKRRSVRKFTKTKVSEAVMRKCLKASLLAPNSSNLQPWEFYWIRTPEKKDQIVEACFSQNAAKTAQEIVVAVSRIDTWKRNRDLILEDYKKRNKLIPIVNKYYQKIIPFAYVHDRLGFLGVIKRVIYIFLNIFVTPTNDAVYKMAGFMFPFLSGGVHKTTSLHPAIFAGIASINMVENNGAVPPGIYNPTFSIATFFLQHFTPLFVSIIGSRVF